MTIYKFNEQEISIWKGMLATIEMYKQDEIDLGTLISSLAPQTDTDHFKDDNLVNQWLDYWQPLEIYNATMLNKNQTPNKEDIAEHLEAMKFFLENQMFS